MNAKRIFVSHSHSDNAFCQALVKALRDAGADVWYDEHNLGFGRIRQQIEAELRQRSLFILIVSPTAIQSLWVRDETEWFYDLYGQQAANILPVVAEQIDDKDLWLFVRPFKRIEQADGTPFPQGEAIKRTLNTLGFTYSTNPVAQQSEDAKLKKFQVQQKILQILYEGRDDQTLALEGEDLADLLGKPWHAIKPEVDDLQHAGLVDIQNRARSNRIYHFYTLTPAGIKAVEHPEPMLKPITIFISSPGDVQKERAAAKRVIERINDLSSIASRYVLRALRYEDIVPAEVGQGPQQTVDRYMREAGNADIFICILSQRMGTAVLDESTGEQYQSGTEYEFMSAYRSHEQRGKPHMLLYRGMKPLPANSDQEQWGRVNIFFQQFEGIHAKLKGLYKTYKTMKEFEDKLFHDLDTLIAQYFLS